MLCSPCTFILYTERQNVDQDTTMASYLDSKLLTQRHCTLSSQLHIARIPIHEFLLVLDKVSIHGCR